MILLAGYSLHIPSFSFKNIFISPAQQTLHSFFVVDILQIIATGLFVLLTAIIFFKTEKVFYNFCAVMTLLILFLGPFAWKTDFYKQMLLIFANYFNRMHGSFFPIFPWRGFIFAGAFIAKFYLQARSETNAKEFANRLIISGIFFHRSCNDQLPASRQSY